LDPDVDTEAVSLLFSTFRSILMIDKPNLVNVLFANDHIHPIIDCLKRNLAKSNAKAFEETGKVALEVTQVTFFHKLILVYSNLA
jgi:hypothetical protein